MMKEIELIEVGKKSLEFLVKKNYPLDYLLSIGFPLDIFYMENINYEMFKWLDSFSDEIHLHIIKLMFEDKLYDTVADIKNSKILSYFNLPICEFWLEFINTIKMNFIRCELQVLLEERL